MVSTLTYRGAWVAQSVKQPTSAQFMISQLVSSSLVSLCADSSEPGASLSPSKMKKLQTDFK